MNSLQNFSQVKILVIGDLMLDRYWWGNVSRISPEAPVPVVHLKNSTYAAGGAANVAANIAGLGAKPYLIGLIGDDEDARSFCTVLESSKVPTSHLVFSKSRPTTVKTRVIAHNQQVVRIDRETVAEPDQSEESKLFAEILKVINEVQLVIISDYAKGLLTDDILLKIIDLGKQHGKKILVDPKGKNYLKYCGATLLTPNKKEAAEACKIDENEVNWIQTAGERLISEVELEAILITQGEEGMTLINKNGELNHFHASAREIYDVTGAGDTVIATLGVALGVGESLENAAAIANAAAGIVVEQVGTTAIKFNDLFNYLQKDNE